MHEKFVIGLPVQIRSRLEAFAKKEETPIVSVLTDIGRQGSFRLLPDPSNAIYLLREYYAQFQSGFDDCLVIVLPYAPIPQEVEAELITFADLGGKVIWVNELEKNWPVVEKKKRPDSNFFNDVFDCLKELIFGSEIELLSESVKKIIQKNPNILLVDGALDTCDSVASHRHDFIKLAVFSFAKFIENKGQVGRIDAFFRENGLEHAQSGGITTTLTVTKNGKQIHTGSATTHLKNGDATLKVAAARVYYQEFFDEGECYVALLYAGIHPDSNIKKEYDFFV